MQKTGKSIFWPFQASRRECTAHLELGGGAVLPINNSTFDLALHDWYEPLERAQAAAKDQGVTLVTPIIGEAVRLQSPKATKAWWKDEMATDLRLVSE
ncbi:hypothetical protein [Microbulbifer sp. TRSA007]|uniref:hypothetical protein n=1 Tax=unclassified Microbulbifer TaxID=2619833 RepID=UPI00403A57D2